jgi:hypothetical protein
MGLARTEYLITVYPRHEKLSTRNGGGAKYSIFLTGQMGLVDTRPIITAAQPEESNRISSNLIFTTQNFTVRSLAQQLVQAH